MSAIVLTWVAGLAIGFQPALAILTIAGFVVATVFMTRPSVGLLGIGILCTADTLTRGLFMHGDWLRYNTFNYFLIIVILLQAPLLLRLQGVQIRILQLFLIVAGVGVVFNPSVASGLAHLLTLVSPLGLLAYCVAADRDDKDEVWYWLGIVNGTFGALGGVVYYVQQSDLPYSNPNEFSYFPLTAMFSICLARVFSKPHGQGVLAYLAAVNLCWVFLSGSRGGLLVAGCCAAFLLMQTSGIGRRAVTVVVGTLVCMVTIVWFPELGKGSKDRMARLIDPALSYAQRTSGRSELVADGWRLFLERPLGVGTGGFASARLAARDLDDSERTAAHAGWVKVLVENGLPGICLLALFVLSFAFVAWHRTPQVFSLGLFVTVTLGAVYVPRELGDRGAWLLAAAAMTLLRAERRPNRKTAEPPPRSNGCTNDNPR